MGDNDTKPFRLLTYILQVYPNIHQQKKRVLCIIYTIYSYQQAL